MTGASDVPGLIAKANRIAAQIDHEQANAERRELIDELSTLIEREELGKLPLACVNLIRGQQTTGRCHRPGEMDLETVEPNAEFHDFLRDLCHRYQVDLDTYPNFRLYMEYIDTIREAIRI